jgi:hypothetical protein
MGVLTDALPPAIVQQLDALLQADEGMDAISALKHEPKDVSDGALRREVVCRAFCAPLHACAKSFLASAGLSNESVTYYALVAALLVSGGISTLLSWVETVAFPCDADAAPCRETSALLCRCPGHRGGSARHPARLAVASAGRKISLS